MSITDSCLRYFADVSKKLQKGHNFWQFKDHKSGRRYENKVYDPIFFICFSSSVKKPHFCILNLSKFIFLGHPFVHSGLQNTWILEVKAVRLGFCPIRFKKDTHWEKWKTRFYFFYWVENKFRNVQGNLMIYKVTE